MNEAIEAIRPRCVNALAGLEFWFCYHYNGHIVPGREALNERGECGMCGTVSGTNETVPSFLLADADL